MADNTLTPEERQKIYDEEKTRIEAREKIEKEKEEERNRPADPVKIPPVIVWMVIIGFIVFFVVLVIHPPRPDPPTPPPPNGTGTEARIQFGDGQYPAWVSEDEQTYKELVAAVTAKDTVGYNKLLYSGKVFEVATGTKVLVLEPGLERSKVRILEGNNSGRSGWVPRQGVR